MVLVTKGHIALISELRFLLKEVDFATLSDDDFEKAIYLVRKLCDLLGDRYDKDVKGVE